MCDAQQFEHLRAGYRRRVAYHYLRRFHGPEFKATGKKGGTVEGAAEIGTIIGKMAQEKGVTKVVFDRGGHLYHGRVKALADAAREAGLVF